MISAQGITAQSLLSENNDHNNALSVRDVTKAVMAAIGVEATESVEKIAEGAHVENVFPILSQQLRWESESMTVEEAQAEKKPKDQEVSLKFMLKINLHLHASFMLFPF